MSGACARKTVRVQVLRTARLTLRKMTVADLDDMAALLGDPQVMRYYPSPKSRSEAQAWIDWNLDNYQRYGFGLWVAQTHDGDFVGDCGLTMQEVKGRKEVEVGYHVRAELQGQGLATEAAVACRDYAAAMGVTRLIAIIDPQNAPSQRVALKIGLAMETTVIVHGSQQRIYAAQLLASTRG